MKHTAYKFLRHSEKYTKTDMVYLVKGGYWLTLTNVANALNVLIIATAFANLLPKEIYGQYKYILAAFAILKLFTLEGINTALVRATAKKINVSYIAALKTRILWGFIGTISLLALSGYYLLNGNRTLGAAFLIAGIFIPFFENFEIYNSYLNGKKKFETFSKLKIILESCTTVILLLCLVLTNNLLLILATYFGSYTIIRFLIFYLLHRKFNFNGESSRETINYGKHLTAMGIISRIAENFDKIFLWYVLGPLQLAIYSFAIALPEQIKALVKQLKTLAIPKMSENTSDEMKKALSKKVFKAMAFATPITIIYIILAPVIFKILFPQYLDSVIYSQIFSSVIILAPQCLFMAYLEANAKKKELYFIQMFIPIIKMLLYIALIPIMGIMGLIIAIITARSINFLTLYYFFKRN